MLLRSSSTPIPDPPLSFSDSLSNHHHHSFRRAHSEGNLHSLLSNTATTQDPHHLLKSPSASRIPNAVLDTAPSFSILNSNQVVEVEEEEEELEQEAQDSVESIGREFSFSGAAKESACTARTEGEAGGSAVTAPLFLARGLGIDRVASGLLCVGGDGGGRGSGGNRSVMTDGGGERSDAEMYYRKMVEEHPGNALFLRNYAQFLYEAKGDPKRAEEYYSRAILAEPGDGEILSQYAKLIWELHEDEERASSYFEQAVKAAPNDSHVLAAYAGFLWETEVDDGGGDNDPSQAVEVEEEPEQELKQEAQDSVESIRQFSFFGAKERVSAPLFLARGLGIDRVASGLLCIGGEGGGRGSGGNCSVMTGSGGERSDAEMYYRTMVEDHPGNALFLRNYAQFLYEAKGDAKRAEEYYSRAILAEPGDGEILSQYAKLVWELHEDEERASSYFEQAVKAAPNDIHVLAAYAGFLWETDDDDGGGDNNPSQDHTGLTTNHASLASASA